MSFFDAKKESITINRVLVIHDNLDNNNIYIKAIKALEKDFDITITNGSLKGENGFKNFNDYDFIIVISGFKRNSHKKFKSVKNKKKLSGLIIIDEVLPQDSNDTKCYDVLWFSTYNYAKKIPKAVFKIHAYGIDYELKEDFNPTTIEEQILYSRLNNKSLKPFESLNHEFLKSPIWDLQYLSLQLQKGLNAFKHEKIRATNLITSSIKLKAGRFSFYNKNLLITGDEYVSIGSFCSFGKNVSIYTSNHDTNYAATQGFIYRKYFNSNHPGEQKLNPSKSRTKGPVIIKNDVWVGDGVKIMSGVTVGNGACIAAGSIVTSNVGDYEIVGGIPAKKIKIRFNSQKLIDQLLELEWWHWSDKKIALNNAFFTQNLNELEHLNDIEIN